MYNLSSTSILYKVEVFDKGYKINSERERPQHYNILFCCIQKIPNFNNFIFLKLCPNEKELFPFQKKFQEDKFMKFQLIFFKTGCLLKEFNVYFLKIKTFFYKLIKINIKRINKRFNLNVDLHQWRKMVGK